MNGRGDGEMNGRVDEITLAAGGKPPTRASRPITITTHHYHQQS